MSMICFAHKIGRLDTAISETFNISSETLGNEGQQPPLPQQPDYPSQQPPPIIPQQNQGQASQLPKQYQQPVQDMGTSLGYGQGMEYQYVNTPQPSQPLPQLRQARLQQLREDRMRRQQRRMKPDSPSFFTRKSAKPPSNAVPPPPIIP